MEVSVRNYNQILFLNHRASKKKDPSLLSFFLLCFPKKQKFAGSAVS